MKKRILTILSSAAMLSALLSGCGSAEKGEPVATVTEAAGTTASGEDIETASKEDEETTSREQEEALNKEAAAIPGTKEAASKEEMDSEETDSEKTEPDTAQAEEDRERIWGDDDLMEIFAGSEIISLPDDVLIGQASVEDILLGDPILYARVKTGGFAFEWLISDYEYEDNMFMEDGVLLISKEDNVESAQVIHVQAEGGLPAPRVSLDDLFRYMDVNFDGVPDLLICTGYHGNQGAISYYCFLQTDAGFVEAPTFTEIVNPAVDTENKLILSQWRNSAASHSWAEYKYKNNEYMLARILTEDAELREDAGSDEEKWIWVWEVGGEEIGRSDQLSESEIADLLYNENSEWRLADDRWRTIHNAGLMVDFSIYSEP